VASAPWQLEGKKVAEREELVKLPGVHVHDSLERLSEGSWQCPCGSQLMYFKKKKKKSLEKLGVGGGRKCKILVVRQCVPSICEQS